MVAIQRAYGERGVRRLAISSNDAENTPSDSFGAMRERAREKGFNFPYLCDEPQEVARALGSERTQEVLLFACDRLVYRGAIDDSRDKDAVSQHYLRDLIRSSRQSPVDFAGRHDRDTRYAKSA